MKTVVIIAMFFSICACSVKVKDQSGVSSEVGKSDDGFQSKTEIRKREKVSYEVETKLTKEAINKMWNCSSSTGSADKLNQLYLEIESLFGERC